MRLHKICCGLCAVALLALTGCGTSAPPASIQESDSEAPAPQQTTMQTTAVQSPQTLAPGETGWIDPNEVQVGPILHEQLSEELVARIKQVHATFGEVDGYTLDEWIDDFRRDPDPEENIQTWEDMQLAFSKYLAGRDLDLDTRKEVFQVVLLRSMAAEDEVLARMEFNKLTADDAKEIMAAYPSPPKPIEVTQEPATVKPAQ